MIQTVKNITTALTGLVLLILGLSLLFATLYGFHLSLDLGGFLSGTTRTVTFLLLSGFIYYGGVCVMERLDKYE